MPSGNRKPWEHAKAAGGGSEADALAARFVESLSQDTRLYAVDIRGSMAHARMLESVGLITPQDLRAIERGLGEIQQEIESAAAGPTAVGVAGAWPGWKLELEDVHMCIESALVEKIGDAGRKLHTGRSRNDQVALDLRLWVREACGGMANRIDAALAALESLADKHGDVVIPSYTHMQRAQPSTVGGELAAWHAMLSRDRHEFERLGSAAAMENPLGSGAVAGTSLPIDRHLTTEMLGFGAPSGSAIDATASRDEGLDFLYACSRCAMHLSRLAEQWILYCSTEFGMLSLAAAYTTGSSMMPQKRNPDMLELIRGRCGTVFGHFSALMMICKGLPLAYNRDLQEDKRHIFGAHDVLTDCLEITAGMIATAEFRRPAQGLDRGHLDATSLAEYLVNKGIPFRTAHQIVGTLVRQCDESGRHCLSQLSVDEISAAIAAAGIAGIRASRDVSDWLGAENVVRRYRSSGHAGGGAAGYREYFASARIRRGGAMISTPPPGGPLEITDPPPASPPSLFGEESPAEQAGGITAEDTVRLIAAYGQVGRTLDDLPYTDDFERLMQAVGAAGGEGGGGRVVSRREVFHKLHNLRKAGKLPKVGRAGGGGAMPARLTPEEEQLLCRMVEEAVGTLGQRDQLPYTAAFDWLVERFNAQVGRQTDPHTLWRLVAKLAK